jgi:aspartate aminotransferase
VNAPAIMQKAVCHLRDVCVDISIYRKKRDFLYDNLVKMGYSVVKPMGAFYIFPKSPIPDDEAYVMELKDLLVLTTPDLFSRRRDISGSLTAPMTGQLRGL